MTRKGARILLECIVPIIKSVVPRTVKPVATEDFDELVQDTVASAAGMLDSVEKSGRTPIPRSIAFYSIQRTRSGRRSCQHSASDPLGPLFRTANESAVSDMDAPLSEEGAITLHDVVASRREDPASEAGRRLDWAEFSATLCSRDRTVLSRLADGWRSTAIAGELGVSPARVTHIKRAIAGKLKAFMGDDILGQICAESVWERDLRMIREREAYYASVNEDDEPEAA